MLTWAGAGLKYWGMYRSRVGRLCVLCVYVLSRGCGAGVAAQGYDRLALAKQATDCSPYRDRDRTTPVRASVVYT